jgi:hypothetical protein
MVSMSLSRTHAEWFTLVRFDGTPANLTAVAQTRTAAEALVLAKDWSESYPSDTTVVFDEHNAPIALTMLSQQVDREQPATSLVS